MNEDLPRGVCVEPAAHDALLLVEVWGAPCVVESRLGASLPTPGQALAQTGWRALWWERATWLIRAAAGEETLAKLSIAVEGEGAVTDVSGAFRRIVLRGPAWRPLLMIGGVFDAESPNFGPGCVAGTVIHHMPVRIDVLSSTTAEAYVPPSYAEALLHHWRGAAGRLSGLR